MKDTAEKALLAIKAAFKMAVHKLPHVEKKKTKTYDLGVCNKQPVQTENPLSIQM